MVSLVFIHLIVVTFLCLMYVHRNSGNCKYYKSNTLTNKKFYTTYRYKIRSTTNNSIPEIAENMLHIMEKNNAPDLHSN